MQLRFFSSLLFVLSIARDAAAHGAPPSATAALAHDADGVRLVRLSQGLAQRVDDGFRLICPEAWGGDVTAVSSPLADGSALIAGDELFLVEADGRVVPHPEKLGRASALASSREAAFGLFPRGAGRVELHRIDRASSQLLRTLDEPFSALAADEEQLSLLRFLQRSMLLQRVSLDGELGELLTWDAPSRVDYAALRAEGQQLYVLAWGVAAPWVTLGRIGAQGAELLSEAQSAIAGPLVLGDATLFVRDGALATLDAGNTLSPGEQHVTCLDRIDGLDYACVDGGLRRVDARGLGAPLFELRSLREPDYAALPAAARSSCMLRWQDLALHLAEIAAAEAEAEAKDESDAGVEGEEEADAGRAAPTAGSAGCALRGGRASSGGLALVLVALATLLGRVRRRR